MATVASAGGNFGSQVGNGTIPVSTVVTHVKLHANLTAAVSSAAELRACVARIAADSNAIVVKVSNCTRGYLYCKYTAGASALTSTPVVRIFGFDQEPSSSAGAFAATAVPMRLDNTTAAVDAGVTMAIDLTEDISDGTYKYSFVSFVDTGLDLRGSRSITALVETLAAATGLTVCELWIAIVN